MRTTPTTSNFCQTFRFFIQFAFYVAYRGPSRLPASAREHVSLGIYRHESAQTFREPDPHWVSRIWVSRTVQRRDLPFRAVPSHTIRRASRTARGASRG